MVWAIFHLLLINLKFQWAILSKFNIAIWVVNGPFFCWMAHGHPCYNTVTSSHWVLVTPCCYTKHSGVIILCEPKSSNSENCVNLHHTMTFKLLPPTHESQYCHLTNVVMASVNSFSCNNRIKNSRALESNSWVTKQGSLPVSYTWCRFIWSPCTTHLQLTIVADRMNGNSLDKMVLLNNT